MTKFHSVHSMQTFLLILPRRYIHAAVHSNGTAQEIWFRRLWHCKTTRDAPPMQRDMNGSYREMKVSQISLDIATASLFVSTMLLSIMTRHRVVSSCQIYEICGKLAIVVMIGGGGRAFVPRLTSLSSLMLLSIRACLLGRSASSLESMDRVELLYSQRLSPRCLLLGVFLLRCREEIGLVVAALWHVSSMLLSMGGKGEFERPRVSIILRAILFCR